MSLCTTAHPLHTGIANMFGASFSETTMRPNPRWSTRNGHSTCCRCPQCPSQQPQNGRKAYGHDCVSSVGASAGLSGPGRHGHRQHSDVGPPAADNSGGHCREHRRPLEAGGRRQGGSPSLCHSQGLGIRRTCGACEYGDRILLKPEIHRVDPESRSTLRLS